jgi:transposase InsO family protein
MNVHKMARTVPYSRGEIVRRRAAGQSIARIARDLGVSDKTVRKWCGRSGSPEDRSSRPKRSPTQLPEAWADGVLALRRLRFTQERIAVALQLKRSTVARVCARAGLARLSALDPKVPVQRYTRERPGELVHLDTKKLGRIVRPSHRVTGDRRDKVEGAGWEFLHVAIDDATRLAYAEVLVDEKAPTCIGFLNRAVAFFRRHGIPRIERVMTDNGSAYVSGLFAAAIVGVGAVHKRTRPYTPQTNGKAERLIQTLLRTWAYVRPYQNSADRTDSLDPWLDWYNRQRGHAGLLGQTPLEALSPFTGNNLVSLHT